MRPMPSSLANTLIFHRQIFLNMAQSYVKRNPSKNFLLRKSNEPVPLTMFNEEMVWGMVKYSAYEEIVIKALRRVLVKISIQ